MSMKLKSNGSALSKNAGTEESSNRSHRHQMQQTRAGANGDARFLEHRQESFEGLLPHPDHLERYEKILAGSADRILRMAEIEQARVHSFVDEDQSFRSDLLDARRSENRWKQVTAICALTICISAAIVLAWMGDSITAGIVAGTTCVGVVGSILTSQLKGSAEDGPKESKPKSRGKPGNGVVKK